MRQLLAISAILAGGLPTAANADCNSWALNGQFSIHQSDRTVVSADLSQDGNRITGNASFYSSLLGTRVNGYVEGFINGNDLRLRMKWNTVYRIECTQRLVAWCDDVGFKDKVGVYEGSINQNGEIEGVAALFDRPEAPVKWFASPPAECEVVLPPPPPPRSPDPLLSPDSTIVKPRPPDPLRSPDKGLAKPRPFSPSKSRIAEEPGGGFASSATGGAGPCTDGLVPRAARPEDLLCVSPAERDLVQRENAEASRHWVDGAYGPQTCVSGLVWREAFSGDTVCVTPERRQQVKAGNAN